MGESFLVISCPCLCCIFSKNGFKSSGSSGLHCFVMLGNYLLRVKKLDLDQKEGNFFQTDEYNNDS